jgi:hypothetical protein
LPAVFTAIAACFFARLDDVIFHALLSVGNWDQLERIWEFVIGFFKFLWALLRLLGGG